MTTIKFRRDTSANWTSVNPIPAQGEPCYETDTGKLKIGNGSDNYVALPYVSDGGGSSGDLPIATATTLGGIKVGNNLSITEDGTLSASSEAKTVKTPNGNIKLDDAGLHNEDNSRTIIRRNTDGLEVAVGNGFDSTIIYGKSIKLKSTNITDKYGNTFLSGDTINGVKLSADTYGNKSIANSEYTSNRLELTTNACNLYDSDNRQVFGSSYNSGIDKTDWSFASQSDSVRIANKSASNDYGLILKVPTNGTSPTIGYTYHGTDSSLNGKDQTFLRTEDIDNNTIKIVDGKLTASGGGSAGTTDYTQLENKPQINSVELTGNKTLDDLGIQAKGNYLTALPDNAVTTDTTQEITGDKTFTKTITTNNITCNNTLMASTIRTKANGTIKLAHPTNNASGMITLDNNYGQFSVTNGLSSNNNLLQVVSGTAYATLMGNKIETKDKDGNLYHYINSQNITNCLLEVPQRIKLELNDGTLTLKAGSQVIVPNGFETDGTTPKFDYVVIPSDMNTTNFWDDVRFIAYHPNEGLVAMPISISYSGATQPSASQYALWYDTTNNLVKSTNDNGATWLSGISLPICTAYGTNGTTVTRIDQVFNGMGYIGSTIWVDKGVKGLIPNGKNEDGSLKNVEVTVDRVRVTTNTVGDQPNTFGIRSNGSILPYTYFGEYAVPPTVGGVWGLYYNTQEQTFYFNNSSTWEKCQVSLCGNVTYNSSLAITSFQPKLPFRAVDYNDKPEISGWGMPSNRYIDLTLGASGATYTAPANGYAYLSRTATATGQYIALSSTIAIKTIATAKSQSLEVFIPVKKGNSFTVNYTAATLGTFRFVYAEGEV